MTFEAACERDQTYRFDPERTALLSIDWQTDFLTPGGMCAHRGQPYQTLAAVVPAAKRVLERARALGLSVIHFREAYEPDLSDLNPYRTARDTIIGAPGPLGRFLVKGEAGTVIVPEMAPLAGEPTLDKPGFNAFHRPELDRLLKAKGITHVVIIGITTQCCVASTLRGAVDAGYFPLTLQDCTAAFDPADHAATFRVIYSENHTFGWVSDADRFVGAREMVGS